MIYIRKNGNALEKYEISFDKRKLISLRNIIIKKCNKKVHIINSATTFIPDANDKLHFKNINSIILNQNDFKTVYSVEYDEYIDGYLVKLINLLLEKKSEGLDLLYTAPPKQKTIEDLNNEIELLSNDESIHSFQERMNKYFALKQEIMLLKDNPSKEDESLYYDQVKALIKVELIDSIDMSIITKYNSFITGINNDEFQKILKK